MSRKQTPHAISMLKRQKIWRRSSSGHKKRYIIRHRAGRTLINLRRTSSHSALDLVPVSLFPFGVPYPEPFSAFVVVAHNGRPIRWKVKVSFRFYASFFVILGVNNQQICLTFSLKFLTALCAFFSRVLQPLSWQWVVWVVLRNFFTPLKRVSQYCDEMCNTKNQSCP